MREQNHEGYHDPTACMAVRNVMRGQAGAVLTYRIREAVESAGGARRDKRGTCYQDKGGR
ncbi:MAG TPA: hypothetical protein DCZ91_18165 [Lachnospiraceae bacterium]|nr:hypothetical protein [Lachnospiraceae bacterium]